MTTIVAVSPHLDDAVFSAGALLARRAAAGDRVVIVTCFTATMPNPTGFALACQTDKGLGADVDYMALRRDEDRAACALLGAEAVHLPYPEAPHRGYGSVADLFGPRLRNDGVAADLTRALGELVARAAPELVLGPAGIGNHVDHWIVREALEAVARPTLWADLPYFTRPGVALPPGGERLRCGAEGATKVAAARAYASQLCFQFNGAERVGEVLGDSEIYWPATLT